MENGAKEFKVSICQKFTVEHINRKICNTTSCICVQGSIYLNCIANQLSLNPKLVGDVHQLILGFKPISVVKELNLNGKCNASEQSLLLD